MTGSMASAVWLVKFAWIRACVKARPLDHPDKNASQKRVGHYGNCVLNVCQHMSLVRLVLAVV